MTNQLQHQQRRAVDVRIPAIEKYAYCLCLHVKPTTIFIAVFKLIRALLFASILLNTEFSVNEQVNDLNLALDDRHKSTAAALNIFARIVMASVSAVGIYAVISGRAALLMPLYAMLLVDFFIALPAFYNRDLDPSLADSLADFKNYSSGTNQYTRYSLMLFSTITMIVKIYFLCVIWKCYRYLRLIELVSPLRLQEIYPHIHQNGGQYPIVRVLSNGDSTDLGPGHNMAPPPYESIASSMKPPNYEEAMKSSSNMAYPANPGVGNQQQQTIVFANANPEQQNISTQIINDAYPTLNSHQMLSGGLTDSCEVNVETSDANNDTADSTTNHGRSLATDIAASTTAATTGTTASSKETTNVDIPRTNGNTQ